MTVAVHQPQREDSLTKIARGLQVAQGILGIKQGFDEAALNKQKFEAAQAEKKLADQRITEDHTAKVNQRKWEETGGISTEKAADLRAKNMLVDPAPGLPTVRVRTADGEKIFGVKDAPKDTSVADDKKDEKLRSARERAQNGLNRQLEDFDTQIASADEVIEIAEIAKTNPAAAGAIGLKMARAAGEKGILSDADKKDYGGSQALQDRIARYVQRAQEGTLTNEDAAFAASFAQTMREASLRRKKDLTERNVRQFTRNYGGDFEENYAIITGMDYEKPTADQRVVSDQKSPAAAGVAQTQPAQPIPRPEDLAIGDIAEDNNGVPHVYVGNGQWKALGKQANAGN